MPHCRRLDENVAVLRRMLCLERRGPIYVAVQSEELEALYSIMLFILSRLCIVCCTVAMQRRLMQSVALAT